MQQLSSCYINNALGKEMRLPFSLSCGKISMVLFPARLELLWQSLFVCHVHRIISSTGRSDQSVLSYANRRESGNMREM